MIAGPNGAGKSTLTRLLRERGVEFGDYINPDEIAAELEGSYNARVARAQLIADQRRDACIDGKRSFSFETVMSHPSKVDILTRAKTAGFQDQLVFVGTADPRMNVTRVALRVAQGGHDVPEDRIIARWHRTMKLLHEAILAADEALIFDNSVGAAGTPRLIFRSTSQSDGKLLQQQLLAPVPAWVQHYVLDLLEVHLSMTPR
jgi:predicted ABC-type ATPase